MTETSSESPVAPVHSQPVRFNETLLSGQERKVLQAIAQRLPAATTPDQLTVLGVFGAIVVVIGYVLSERDPAWLWLANLGLALHWAGDSLDGTLARLRQIERPKYGFYLDQVVDTLGNILIALGVGMAPWVRMDLVLIVLALYQMTSIQAYVRAIVDHEFHLAVGGMGPTEMRLGIVILNCAVMFLGEPQGIPALHGARWPDVVVALLAVVLFFLWSLQLKRHLARFSGEDPPRRGSR